MRALRILIGISLSLAACGDGGPNGGVDGTYALATVNGETLPFSCFFNPIAIVGLEITAGSVSLQATGSWGGFLTIRETNGASITTENATGSGTWTESGGTVQFSDPTGGPFTGTLSGNSLTVVENDFVDDGCPILTLRFEK